MICVISSAFCMFYGLSGKIAVTSKTTLGVGQSPFSSVSPELVSGFRLDRTYAKQGIEGSALQIAVFGGLSTSATKNDIAHYFLPFGKLCLSVAEDGLENNFEKKKDLLAQNFNIFTHTGDFRSEISIAPEQNMVGCGVHWRYCLLRNPLSGNSVWISLSAPLIHIINKLNVQEHVISTGNGVNTDKEPHAVGTMKEALNQNDWLFGKMPPNAMRKTSLADIEAKVGFDNYLVDNLAHIELYGGILIPTTSVNTGKYVFEPIAGRGGHAGIMLGNAFDMILLEDYLSQEVILWEIAFHGEYLFRRKEMRSFDLIDRPWSRYMPLYRTQEQAMEASTLSSVDILRARNIATPGINILTQPVIITPGFACDTNMAFILKYNHFNVELGYNIFFKEAENIRLQCDWPSVSAIKYTEGQGQTNPIRDITGNKYLEQKIYNYDEEPLIPVSLMSFENSIIRESDLDLLSAVTPARVCHTIYVALTETYDQREYPLVINGGSSYAFSGNNAVIAQWKIWIKAGVSF